MRRAVRREPVIDPAASIAPALLERLFERFIGRVGTHDGERLRRLGRVFDAAASGDRTDGSAR